eukprot:131532-Prymnesium_polylepis.1
MDASRQLLPRRTPIEALALEGRGGAAAALRAEAGRGWQPLAGASARLPVAKGHAQPAPPSRRSA